MSYWDLLPSCLHRLIFEFDSTYNKTKEELIKELIYRTPFWRIKYINLPAESNHFENRRKEIMFISNCWNNTYNDFYKDKPEIEKKYTEEEFLTDNTPNKYHIVFRDLKVLKNYNFIFNDIEVRLIRRNVTTAEKISTRNRLENKHS